MKIDEYLSKRKMRLAEMRAGLLAKQKEWIADLEVLREKLSAQEKMIDIGYELFSPKSKTADFNKEEISHYKKRIETIERQKQENDIAIQEIVEEMDFVLEAEKELSEWREKQATAASARANKRRRH